MLIFPSTSLNDTVTEIQNFYNEAYTQLLIEYCFLHHTNKNDFYSIDNHTNYIL